MSETKFKEYLIKELTRTSGSQNWIDGDGVNQKIKTPDLINSELKIAVELKDDQQFRWPKMTPGVFIEKTIDLARVQSQFKGDIRDANKKFREFRDHFSVLIVRSEHHRPTFEYLKDGLVRIGFDKERGNFRLPNTGVGFTTSSEQVAIFSFYNPRYNELYYCYNSRYVGVSNVSKSRFEELFSFLSPTYLT